MIFLGFSFVVTLKLTFDTIVNLCVFKDANVNATTGTGDSALTYACENGHTEVADVLLEHGAVLVSISLV